MADLEALGVGYLVAGKLYDDLQGFISGVGESSWGTYQNGDQEWRYVELGDRRGNWKKFRRALFCQPLYEDRQRLLEFARSDQILYTNLGCGSGVDEQLRAAGLERWLEAEALLEGYHGRGADELVHRALKDFCLPDPALQALSGQRRLLLHDAGGLFPVRVVQAGRLRSGGAPELLCHHLAPAAPGRGGKDRAPRRADSFESDDGHLGAASNPATVGEERQSSGLWLDLKPGGTGSELGGDGGEVSLQTPVCHVGLGVVPELHLFFTPLDLCIRQDTER